METKKTIATVTRVIVIMSIMATMLGMSCKAIAQTMHIRSASELEQLSSKVQSGTDFKGWTIYLDNDIYLRGDWHPIGDFLFGNENNPKPFKGTFDGQGKSISNISINSSYTKLGGLFGLVDGGTVKNLVVKNVTINNVGDCGGVVARLTGGGTVENCTFKEGEIRITTGSTFGSIVGNVVNGNIRGCQVYCKVKLRNIQTSGGIAGNFSAGEMTNCLFQSAQDDLTGPIFGAGQGSVVKQCYYTSNNTNMNNAFGTKYRGYQVHFSGIIQPIFTEELTNYDVSGITAVNGGLMYDGYLYAAEGATISFTLKANSFYEYVIVNEKFDGKSLRKQENQPLRKQDGPLKIKITKVDGNHTVEADVVQLRLSGKGTSSDPYLVSSAYDLDILAKFVNNGGPTQYKYFFQDRDITYDGTPNGFAPVGDETHGFFDGTYDAQGHTVSGIRISSIKSVNTGVFGAIQGTVKNLKVSNCVFLAGKNTGAVVGYNRGRVQNCHVASDVTVTSSGSFSHLGGVAGYNIGTIDGCTSAAKVSNDTQAKGYGGIVGNNGQGGTVSNCLYYGNRVWAGATSYVGGIAGYEYNSTFKNNLYNMASTDIKGIGDENAYDNENADRAYSIISGTEGLTLDFGKAYWTYEYEGLALYNSGMLYNGVFYAKTKENVGFIAVFDSGMDMTELKASSGKLKVRKGENACNLEVANENVVITASLAEIVCLDSNSDNTVVIGQHEGQQVTVMLKGRTFSRDVSWSTLCLPFNLDSFKGTPLEGAKVKKLGSSEYTNSLSTLKLNFELVSSLEAGVPYIVKFVEGEDEEDPMFRGVTVTNELTPTETKSVKFIGNFSPVTLQANDKKKIYMNDRGKYCYPNTETTVAAQQCYFELIDPLKAGEALNENAAANSKAFFLDFGEGETTAIEGLDYTQETGTAQTGIFDLQGRRVQDGEAKHGIYIVNGKKVMK